MKYLVVLFGVLSIVFCFPVWSKEDKKSSNNHAHEKGEDAHQHEEHADKEKSHGPAHRKDEKDDHGHAAKEGGHEHEEGEHGEEEAGENVGPDKGIIEASAETGIKLSPEALKNYEIRTLKLTGSGPWQIPTSARLLAGEEVNLYRVRDGAFKRIDFTQVKKTPEHMTINSTDLKSGDEIVISGIGFLRIAELAAFGGAPEGHSH